MTTQIARDSILSDIIKKITKQENIQNYEVKKEEIKCTGKNYTAAIYLIKVISERGTLDLFAKVANANEGERKAMRISQMYQRELFFYLELVPHYDEMQEKHKIPEEDRFRFVKHYASNPTLMEECIILENLSVQGYSTPDRFEPMDWIFASKAVAKLAKFHALSYAFERENPTLFDELVKSKEEHTYTKSRPAPDINAKYINNRVECVIAALSASDAEIFKEFVKNTDLSQGFLDQHKLQRRPCLIHGDYKHTNLLTKYEEPKLVDIYPVDYQQVHYGSPINDLMYFIFSGSDEQFRNMYYDQLIEHYYSTLSASLAQFSLKINDVYPRQDFDADLKERTIYGLYVGIFILPYMLASGKPDFNTSADKFIIDSGIEFNERFNGIFNDFVKWKYL